MVLYESPHRIVATLGAIGEVFGEVELVVARELTKQYEEIVTATPAAHLARLAAGPVRGEFTLVIPTAKSVRVEAQRDADPEPGHTR